MREYRFVDFLFLTILFTIYMFSNYATDDSVSYLFNLAYQAFKLTLDIFFMCYVEPLNAKNKIARNGPFYQHALTRVIKYLLKDLENFEMQYPSFSFVSNIVWKYFFTTRAFIQSYNIVELSDFKEYDNGVLIYSLRRTEDHDILIIYVPNIPIFGSSPFFYVEYMMTLQSLLLLQGFNSPGVFIMKFPEECKSSTMEYNLTKLIENYIKITQENPNSKIILMGDAIGATLILNFLSTKQKIFFNEKINYGPDSSNETIKDPFATILISPIVSFNDPDTKTTSDDYLKQENIDDLAVLFCSDRSAEMFNPSLWKTTEIWEKLVPKGGMVVTFGDQELQSEEIESMSKIAFQTGRVKIMKAPNKSHCWQFVSFLTEETQDEKEDSCFLFAGLLSRLVLFQTEAYRDPSKAFEPMNMLTIDDNHL